MESRLRKKIESNFGDAAIPQGLLFRDFDMKIVDKDKITDKRYGPSISREWKFQEPIDNPEWALQTSFTKKTY